MPDPDPVPVTAVPHRMRLICAVAAAAVVVVMIIAAVLLKQTPRSVVEFRTSDQIGMAVLGVVLGAGILFLARPRVDADARGVRVRNILGAHELPWSVVQAVRFGRDSAWASLLLVTGEEIAVLALQAVDKERAVAAVDGLRALHAANRTPSGQAPESRE